MQRLIRLTLFSFCTAAVMAPAQAQTYPSKAVRFVVPFVAGGPTDIQGRMLGEKLSQRLGQQFIIDNRGGANGNIGMELTAKAPPDGYTIVIATVGTWAVNPSLYKSMPYDPVRDFAPVMQVSGSPGVLVVHPSVPAKSVKELVALARAKPGKLDYGSSGVGGFGHISGALFGLMTKTEMVHIPYKSSAPSLTDLIAGQVSMMFANTLSVLPYVNAGRLRALAISSAKRSAAAPSIPTIAENGMPGFDSVTWFGVLAPAGTPRDIINKLGTELRRIAQTRAVADQLIAQGADPLGSSAEEFAARIKSDIAKWTVIIKAAGIKAE